MNEPRKTRRGRCRYALWTAVWATVTFLPGCNVGGYPNLGSRLDTLTSIGDQGALAWMRTEPDGANDILVLGDSDMSGIRRFALMHITPESEGSLRTGTYTLEDERILLLVETLYTKKRELDVSPSGRTGSERVDLSPSTLLDCAAHLEQDKLVISLDGADAVMTDLWDVISTIDPTTQSGVNILARVFNLSTVSLQMRIPGFGGAGLLQYAGSPSSFVGVIGGTGSIEMRSVLSPNAKILFDAYRDYPGITLDGDQISETDMAGDGALSGTVHFSMEDPREGGTYRISGDISYDLTLGNGASLGGGYNVTLSNETTWYVPFEEGETLDFRSILPPS